MIRRGFGRALWLALLGATLATMPLMTVGSAVAAGLATTGPVSADARQKAPDMPSAPAGRPGAIWGPVDVGMFELNFRELPIAVHAGQTFAIGVQAPPGASCAGWISLPGKDWQSLDEVGTRVRGCNWEVTVPLETRPGSLTLATDVSRGGQARSVLGVVYVGTTTLGATYEARAEEEAS